VTIANDITDRLRAALDRDEAVELLRGAIGRESITGHEANFAGFLEQRMRALGLSDIGRAEFAPGRPNVWGERKGAGAAKRLLFIGHTDTVHVDGWREHFRFPLWQQAFSDCNIDPIWYLRERHQDEILPWDHIGSGPSNPSPDRLSTPPGPTRVQAAAAVTAIATTTRMERRTGQLLDANGVGPGQPLERRQHQRDQRDGTRQADDEREQERRIGQRDLGRIGVLAGSFFVILIVLSFFIK
jgi:hypothetical protein